MGWRTEVVLEAVEALIRDPGLNWDVKLQNDVDDPGGRLMELGHRIRALDDLGLTDEDRSSRMIRELGAAIVVEMLLDHQSAN